jgi:hypothetical protein
VLSYERSISDKAYTTFKPILLYGVYNMALSREEYNERVNKLSRLVWDISANIEFPNPYCEEYLYEAIESCTKLLIQLKTYYPTVKPKKYGWWVGEIKKEGDKVSFE